MFRRKVVSSCTIVSRVFLNARRSVLLEDPAEGEKERELRAKIVARYRGMSLRELTNIRYGHFAEQEGATRSTASQAYSAVNQGYPFWQNASNSGQGVDWLMLFTGLALLYVSFKMLFHRLSGVSLDAASVPLWAASPETQANSLLFSIQFDAGTREQIQKAYQGVRHAYPFTDFFEWVRIHYPEYGQGIVFGYEAAVNSLVGILCNGDSRTLMKLASGVQKAIKKQNTNPAQRLDDFLMDVGALTTIQSPVRHSVASGYAPLQPPPRPLQLHGGETMSIEGAIESTPGEVHSSVPFQ
ncbi:hypothetical protein TraAM80_04963 [Trypanosoma rangeli]|uniref:Uncharacterized protein n=1 Tax=Trypanosoma rangeli TaxID=5698 RepID=A0A3R7NME4_TRYRA|nr:uncharacterized protein TraAM80_04963 [Trypanosoma rangeli]RNF04832.1 hypothetical protein TraAM80_04963 [Trypanosoma rangeli]|eukprot:RNF04832.1 hypothetical protein TraAM80_04963 [Trypanosoma rangeli]